MNFTSPAHSQEDNTAKLGKALQDADAVVIGAGAGLSTSAGFTYSGERFKAYFSDFEEKYGFHDMYSGGFYPFDTPEEKWAYWSRNIYYTRYVDAPRPVYEELFRLISHKDYCLLYTSYPVMSEGSTSGVNCILLYSIPSTCEKASAIVVFPTPGISSSSMWPPAKIVIRAFASTWSLPTTAFFSSFTTSLRLIIKLPCPFYFCAHGAQVLYFNTLHCHSQPHFHNLKEIFTVTDIQKPGAEAAPGRSLRICR